MLLEHDPFAVVEAMTIAGFATGCTQGFIYLRGEYPEARTRVQGAIDTARSAGLLGAGTFGSGTEFDIEIRRGAGAYICGEETALFNSLEGKRGEPRSKPPFPAQVGLFGQPTVVNNVETLVNVLAIVLEGGPAFARIGTAQSTGPKLFCVSGAVARPGTYEVPFGATLRELLELAGVAEDLRAVLLGGAAGSFVTREELDRARAVIRGQVHRTPLLSTASLGARCGMRLHVKCENLQKTGSYKPRGGVNRIGQLDAAEKRRGVLVMSAGNLAQGVAYAARQAGVRCWVSMLATAAAAKIDAVRGYGAEVVLHPDPATWFEGVEALRAEKGALLIDAWADAGLIAGYGSIGAEILEDLPDEPSCLGAHVEGPFLNPDVAGAQAREHIRPVDPGELTGWLETGRVRMVTLAPELHGAFAAIGLIASAGAIPALGHTATNHRTASLAIDEGVRFATHVSSARYRARPSPEATPRQSPSIWTLR